MQEVKQLPVEKRMMTLLKESNKMGFPNELGNKINNILDKYMKCQDDDKIKTGEKEETTNHLEVEQLELGSG